MASQPTPPIETNRATVPSTPTLSSNASPILSPALLGTPSPGLAGPAIGAGVRSPSVNATAPTPPVASTSYSTSSGAPTYPTAATSALETYKKKDNAKVVVRFKAIGNAPIMKNNYFRITAFNRFQAVIQFLRKELGWKQGDALFLYINSSFSPAPDDSVGNLFRCFGTEGHLIVNYSTQAAWG